MKYAKKFVSLLLALIMVFAMTTTAFAAQEGTLTGGSITINDAVPGQIYNAYQILYLESYNKDANAYAYKANSAWETWLKTQTGYVSFDAQGYVTWVEGADAAAFAKLAQAQAVTMTADASMTAPAAAEAAPAPAAEPVHEAPAVADTYADEIYARFIGSTERPVAELQKSDNGGAYIYAGEDLPIELGEPMTAKQKAKFEELQIIVPNVLKKFRVSSIDDLTYQQAEFVINAKEKSLEGSKK